MCINAVGDTTGAVAAAILLFLIAIAVAMCHMQITHRNTQSECISFLFPSILSFRLTD